MGKKKFINKKKSTTFSLVYRDSSDPASEDPDAPDRVFIQTGGSSYVPGFSDDVAEAQSDDDLDWDDSRLGAIDEAGPSHRDPFAGSQNRAPLGEERRREILESGFPDDGYDYLQHLRTIGGPKVGSSFVPVADPNLRLPPDTKAFDASRVHVEETEEDELLAEVEAAKEAKQIKSIRPGLLDNDILAALEEGSDEGEGPELSDLDDDFVLLANRVSEGEVAESSGKGKQPADARAVVELHEEDGSDDWESDLEDEPAPRAAKQREQRMLDTQFEKLAMGEYDDSDIGELEEEDNTARGHRDISEYTDLIDNLLKDQTDFPDDNLGPRGYEFEEPTTSGRARKGLDTELAVKGAAWVGIRDAELKKRVAELAKKAGDPKREETIWVEDEPEREQWDCETVGSTWSNLENHPGTIGAPARKPRKPAQVAPSGEGLIRLGGKQNLPLDYLPSKTRGLPPVKETEPASGDQVTEKLGKKGRAEESKDEKRARKAAIKEARREARTVKKATKELYRNEALKVQQKVAASAAAPQGVHLP